MAEESGRDDDRLQQGVQALETGLGVLEAFVTSHGPMKLKDIAASTNVHPAKAHRYLVSFIRMGYVQQDSEGRYHLGPAALRVGLACIAHLDPVRMAAPVLDELADEWQETVFTAVWNAAGPTVVQWRGPWRNITTNVRTGTVLPMLSTATGNLFATFMRRSAVDPVIDRELEDHPPKNPRVVRTHEGIELMRTEVRRAGLGVTFGGYIDGINGIAAPVFDHEGRLVLSLTLMALASELDPPKMARVASDLKQRAGLLSRSLGFRADLGRTG